MLSQSLTISNTESFADMPSAKSLAHALSGKCQGDYFMARCPAHDDRKASLAITEKDGKLLVRCHAGCTQDAVIDALRRRGLWPERQAGNGKAGQPRKIVRTYDYTDAQGALLFQAVRFAPKDFLQRRPDGKGGWIWNVKGVQLVPYRLPELVETMACERPVFITEGEKDADALARLGLTATCNSGGAGNWKANHAAFLKGTDVIILPDNDEKGREHAETVAASLSGIAARIRVLALPGLAEKGDVSDWLAAGGTADALWQLAGYAPDHETASGDGWPEPEPILSQIDEQPYPLDALPAPIREAVHEVHHFVQAPLSLVAASALSALSLSCQALADVRRASNLEGPISLNLITIAASGERKSTADRLFMKPIQQFQAEREQEMTPDLARYRAQLGTWEAKWEGYKLAIKEATKKGRDTTELEVDLEAHETKKPVKPLLAQFLAGDSTMEAMAWHMAHEWPSVGIVDAEAGAVFGAHSMGADAIMRFLAFLNKMWDGASHRHNRRSSEPFTAQGRLTVALLLQAEALAAFLEKNGALARGIGFFARFLIAHPRSTQGQRLFAEPPKHWPALEVFNRRTRTLLQMRLPLDDAGKLTPPVLPLSAAAKSLWVDHFNRIEAGLGEGGPFNDVQDIASKAADNIARLAALFHVFEHGVAGEIGEACIESAARIVQWHLNEARRFVGQFSAPELTDAVRLDRWLIKACRDSDSSEVARRFVQRCGPGSVRSRKQLDQALTELEELGRIRQTEKERKRLIAVNPRLIRECGQ